MPTTQNGQAKSGTEVAKFDPVEQLKKETAITARDFYAVYDRRCGRKLIPSARVYNNWAKEAGIKTRWSDHQLPVSTTSQRTVQLASSNSKSLTVPKIPSLG